MFRVVQGCVQGVLRLIKEQKDEVGFVCSSALASLSPWAIG